MKLLIDDADIEKIKKYRSMSTAVFCLYINFIINTWAIIRLSFGFNFS